SRKYNTFIKYRRFKMFNKHNELTVTKNEIQQEIENDPNHQLLLTCEENIREDCTGAYINKARTLFSLGFFDHAVLEYWNRSITDLKDKLTIYGLEHFPSELNLKIKTREDISGVKDSQVIEGCYLLGIIDDEAYTFL